MTIQSVTQTEALDRARNNISTANYAAIFNGFAEKGIPGQEIEPRVNVFTFNAWKALGRQVRKGEHGVKVCTWVEMSKKAEDSKTEGSSFRSPKTTTVFHVSQTDVVQ